MLILNLNSKNLGLKLIKFNYLYSLNQLNRYLSNDTNKSIINHLNKPLERLPNTKIYEPFWYNIWEKTKLFSIDKYDSTENRFSMVLPPPNITGDLHIGHALTVAIEDAIFRYQKLKNPNCNSIFLPGYDHAGIGMFSVLDKLSLNKYNRRISDYSKEEFDELTNKWKEERIQSIRDQLKILGAALDFNKERFTLDEQMCKSVKEAFIRLFDDGLIYRDNGIVNWCYYLNSTISDIEVDWINVDKKNRIKFPNNNELDVGVLYDVSLKIKDTDETIIVATTRLNTIPGDVAVAINPNDSRYKHLVGKQAINPITDRLMPIIEDYRVIENFGSGAVKITPSCSFTDFSIAQTHKLDIVKVFDSNGNLRVDNLKDEFKYLNGLSRFKLNDEILNILNKLNQLKGESDHKTRIPICSKTRDLIEYRVLPQWYLNVEKANDFIKEKLKSNELNLMPSNHKNTLLDWMNYDKPWCLSRQINWGHEIPIYKFSNSDNDNEDDECKWIAANSKSEAELKFKKLYSNHQYTNVEQVKDVLDTWFSSSLVPFSYFGWPTNEEELKRFYPLDLMETGYDILKFWVHKMLITSFYLTKQLPFKNVLLHGMIVDANGRKMSKSLGNVIDPLDFINGCTLKDLQNKLKKSHKNGYLSKDQLQTALEGQKQLFPKGLPLNSADGLRLCLYQFDSKYEVFKLDVGMITKNRNLINKIWQSFNFLLFIKQKLNDEQNLDLSKVPKIENIKFIELKEIDKWILSCLNEFINKSIIDYDNYLLHNVYSNFIEFFLETYCDVYMELIKPSIYNEDNEKIKLIRFSILNYCLKSIYLIMHPLLPFITEELYQKLKYLDCELYDNKNYEYKSIYLSSLPDLEYLNQFKNDELKERMSILMRCVSKIRSINNLAQSNKYSKECLKFKIQSTDDVILDFLDSFEKEIKLLGRNLNIEIDFNPPFLLDDGISNEYIVDNNLILKINQTIQIEISTNEFNLGQLFKDFVLKSFEKKLEKQLN